MKIFSGGKSKLKENSAYRNSKDEENEIHETTNKDIDELNWKISGKLYLTSHIKLVDSKLENGQVFQINIILGNQKRW